MSTGSRTVTAVLFVFLGVLYGAFVYSSLDHIDRLITVSAFLFIPLGLALLPYFLLRDRIVRTEGPAIALMWTALCGLFLLLFISGAEGALCLLIIAAPFVTVLAIISLILLFVKKPPSDDQGPTKAALVGLLPLLALAEGTPLFPRQERTDHVEVRVRMEASPTTIWEHIVRVSPISEGEYNEGFFNEAGVPRPLEARLVGEGIGAVRTGYFEGGLVFNERISTWQPGREVSFTIEPDTASIADNVFQRHVLTGDYFRFVSATYTLVPVNASTTELVLAADVRFHSTVNAYNAFWARLLITDFEERLLEVIKKRCELAGRVR